MRKLSFLPQWYIENKENKRKWLMKTLIIIVFFVNIILIDLVLFSLNKVKVLDNKITEMNTSWKNKYYVKSMNKNNKDKTLESFLLLTGSDILKDINFESLNVENNNIDINISSGDLNYIYFVDKIEKNNKFTINHISTYSDAQSEEKYRMNLQLK